MANLCIKTPSSAILVLIFQLLVLRPRPNEEEDQPKSDDTLINLHGTKEDLTC